MNRTLSFVKLDFITVKPYMTFKNLLIFLFISVIIGYGTGEPSMIVGLFMMYGVIYASHPFAVGDKNGIDTLYSTLAIRRKDIVAGRYIYAVSLNVFAGAFVFFVSGAVMILSNKGFNTFETLITILICFIIFSVVEAIQLPIYFKLGYSKAKFWAYLPLAAFPAAVMAVSSFAGKEHVMPIALNFFEWVNNNMILAIAAAAVVWFAIFLASGLLSYGFYKKREF